MLMIKNIKKPLFALILSLAFVTQFVAPSVSAMACSSNILTFPAWYSNVSDDCKSVNITKLNDVWVIALNGVDILLQVVAYAAVGYIIWGGIKYMKSRGEPSAIQNAKDDIMNAIIGLVIAIGSVGIVNLVSKNISSSGTVGDALPKANADAAQLAGIMNGIVFPIAGAIAVIFIIIGGIQYTTSNGDSSATSKAKNTIIYSLVGLVFVIMAFAIVQLVAGRF